MSIFLTEQVRHSARAIVYSAKVMNEEISDPSNMQSLKNLWIALI